MPYLLKHHFLVAFTFLALDLLTGFAPKAFASAGSSCAKLFSAEAYYLVQQHILGGQVDPSTAMRDRFGSSSNPDLQFKRFEDDIIQLFEVAPELRRYTEFLKKWGIKENRLLDIMLYYGTHIWEDPRLVASTDTLVKHVRQISRLHFIKFSDSPTAKRFAYYNTHLTHKSVPQMAHELAISESQVYQDLGKLDLSVNERFYKELGSEKILAIKERLVKNGLFHIASQLAEGQNTLVSITRLLKKSAETKRLSYDEIAAFLGIGGEALTYFMHSQNLSNRGVYWNPSVRFQQKILEETEILILLKRQGQSHVQMAETLNMLFHRSVDDVNHRTEASIQAKLESLGLTKNYKSMPNEYYDAEYGYIILNQRFVLIPLVKYILDRSHMSLTEIAENFGVTSEALKGFLNRNHVDVLIQKDRLKIGFEDHKDDSRQEEVRNKLDRYQQQTQAVDATVEWIREHGGKIPSWAELESYLKLEYNKLMGSARYKMGAAQWRLRVFDSAIDFWMAVLDKAKARGISFSLLDIQLKTANLPAEKILLLRRNFQEEATAIIVDWIYKNQGRSPKTEEFLSEFNISFERLMGQAAYKIGNKYENSRVFDSAFDFWMAVKEKSQERGIEFYLLDIRSHKANLSESEMVKIRQILQTEVLEKVHAWVQRNGRLPKEPDIIRDLKIRYDRLIGSGKYKIGAQSASSRIFDSREDFDRALQELLDKPVQR